MHTYVQCHTCIHACTYAPNALAHTHTGDTQTHTGDGDIHTHTYTHTYPRYYNILCLCIASGQLRRRETV